MKLKEEPLFTDCMLWLTQNTRTKANIYNFGSNYFWQLNLLGSTVATKKLSEVSLKILQKLGAEIVNEVDYTEDGLKEKV